MAGLYIGYMLRGQSRLAGRPVLRSICLHPSHPRTTMLKPTLAHLFEDGPPGEPNTLPSAPDEAFDSDVLDLDQLPGPITDEEHAVHAAARAKFRALGDLLDDSSAALADLRIAESAALGLLFAYKRLLAQRAR